MRLQSYLGRGGTLGEEKVETFPLSLFLSLSFSLLTPPPLSLAVFLSYTPSLFSSSVRLLSAASRGIYLHVLFHSSSHSLSLSLFLSVTDRQQIRFFCAEDPNLEKFISAIKCAIKGEKMLERRNCFCGNTLD